MNGSLWGDAEMGSRRLLSSTQLSNIASSDRVKCNRACIANWNANIRKHTKRQRQFEMTELIFDTIEFHLRISPQTIKQIDGYRLVEWIGSGGSVSHVRDAGNVLRVRISFIYCHRNQLCSPPIRGYNIMRLLRNDAQTINKSIFLKHNNGAHGIKSFQILTANDLVTRAHTHTHTAPNGAK